MAFCRRAEAPRARFRVCGPLVPGLEARRRPRGRAGSRRPRLRHGLAASQFPRAWARSPSTRQRPWRPCTRAAVFIAAPGRRRAPTLPRLESGESASPRASSVDTDRISGEWTKDKFSPSLRTNAAIADRDDARPSSWTVAADRFTSVSHKPSGKLRLIASNSSMDVRRSSRMRPSVASLVTSSACRLRARSRLFAELVTSANSASMASERASSVVFDSRRYHP